jgi:hypothetical protein
MGPTGGGRRSGGLIVTQTPPTARSIEPDREPGAAQATVQSDRITKTISKWALTAGSGKASESRATIGGDRCAGEIAGGGST